jgi:hypothetical protein
VFKMNVTLMDTPRSCLRDLTVAETLQVFRETLLNDFKPLDQGEGSLSPYERVCNMRVKDSDG